VFLTLVLDGGHWSGSRSGRFTHGKITPDNHSIGGWVGPRAGLDVVEKRNFTVPAGIRTPIIQNEE